jgi:hypothetical protein
MAVPAQEERIRGAGSASELARAGTIEVPALDGLSCDVADVWRSAHPQRDALYTSCQSCQRLFVTNTTNLGEVALSKAFPKIGRLLAESCLAGSTKILLCLKPSFDHDRVKA